MTYKLSSFQPSLRAESGAGYVGRMIRAPIRNYTR